jgi:hypothetical protein
MRARNNAGAGGNSSRICYRVVTVRQSNPIRLIIEGFLSQTLKSLTCENPIRMFDRKAHIEALKLVMKDWPIEKIEEHTDAYQKKCESVKVGDNVIHINYSPSILDPEDLAKLKEDFKLVNKELSSYNTGGDIMASVPDIVSDVIVYLGNPTVQEVIVLSLGTNALWDALKYSIALVFRRSRERTVHIITSQTATEKEATFSVKVTVDKETTVEFRFDGISIEDSNKAIQQMRDQFSKTKEGEKKDEQVALYDPVSKNWSIIPYTSELLMRKPAIIKQQSLEEYINELEAKENIGK